MRISLSSNSRKSLFTELEQCGYSLDQLSDLVGKSRRTVYDWRRGKYLMDEKGFSILLKVAELKRDDLNFTEISEFEQKRRAGVIGGKSRYDKYGQLGSLQDKKNGGQASYKARKKNRDDMFSKKEIVKPKEGVDLAEFIGICMGDGSITDYQVTISLNDEDTLTI